jgi:hypothetical protein
MLSPECGWLSSSCRSCDHLDPLISGLRHKPVPRDRPRPPCLRRVSGQNGASSVAGMRAWWESLLLDGEPLQRTEGYSLLTTSCIIIKVGRCVFNHHHPDARGGGVHLELRSNDVVSTHAPSFRYGSSRSFLSLIFHSCFSISYQLAAH